MPLPPLPILAEVPDDAELTPEIIQALVRNIQAVWLYLDRLAKNLENFTPSQVAASLDLGGLGVGPGTPLTGVTLPVSPPTPATPTGLTATGFYKQIGLSWDLDLNQFITEWEVERADDLAFTVNVTTMTTTRAVCWLDPGPLADSTTYYYRTRARTSDPLILSAFCAPVGGTTLANDSTVQAQVNAAAKFIQRAHIQNAVIDTAQINNAAIVTAKIADAQITTAKIALAAITTALIGDAQITTAKIANLAVTSAKVNDLSADKLTAGTITALVKIAANQIELDGVNNAINIYDTQGSPVKRIQIGKFGAGSTDYGIKIWSNAGTLLWDSVTTTAGQIGATSDGLRDLAVITAKLDALAATTAKIANNAVTANARFASGALGYTNATTSYTDTGATITLTVESTSDLVQISGCGNALTEWTGGGTAVERVIGAWAVTRGDNTVLREFGHADNVHADAAAPNIIGPASFFYVDTGVSGSQTYKIRAKVGAADNEITIDRMDMMVVDFKK